MKSLRVSRTANSNLQNKINTSIVYNHLRRRGAMYRAEIARELGLSAPAVTRAINNLLKKHYLLESEKVPSKSGKRVPRFLVNAQQGFVIGIDLMPQPIRVAITDFQCTIIDEFTGFKFADHLDIEEGLVEVIDTAISRRGQRSKLKAVCIGVPAVIDEKGTVAGAFLYPNLKGRNLKFSLESRFNVPIFVENTANLSALAELEFGEGRGSNSFVFLENANGIGAGIVVEGNLVRGHHGAAGEVGFSLVGHEALGYRKDRVGFLESKASVAYLRRAAQKMLRESSLPTSPQYRTLAAKRYEGIRAEDVALAAIGGDIGSAAIIREVVDALVIATHNLVLAVDPEKVIIGRDLVTLPAAQELFIQPISRMLQETLPTPSPLVVASPLGDRVGLLGASYLAIESVVTREYPYRM